MRLDEVEEIIACLPTGRTLFPYFKDRYALLLLAWLVGEEGRSIRDIKASPYRRLLGKPAVREICARAGERRLTSGMLRSAWPPRHRTYRLTLGVWERDPRYRFWNQMSRSGAQLVLQLNFSQSHNREYRRLVKPRGGSPFACSDHPVLTGREETLAWVRLDVDLAAGEALVEEIQCDWIRFGPLVLQIAEAIERGECEPWLLEWVGEFDGDPSRVHRYLDEILPEFSTNWAEATLAATLWFLREELGVKRAFYHTHETGNRLKHLPLEDSPPRSLYSKLPRSFCFEETDEVPELLLRHRERRLRKNLAGGGIRFFRLDL